MIPIVDVKHGKHLNKKETAQLIENALQAQDFKGILDELYKSGVNTNDYYVAAAAKFEYVIPEKADEVVFDETLVLKFADKAMITYHRISVPTKLKEVVIGGIRKKIDGQDKFVNLNIFANGLEETEFDYDGQLEKNFAAEFPNEEGYIEGQSLEQVSAQWSWPDGCYPTYKHCGKGCGDNGKYGGGTPKNALDTCCRTHDRCWANFGTNDCQCDCDFIKCANKNNLNSVLVSVINSIFPMADSCKC